MKMPIEIIAEISGNHMGNFEYAQQLIREAARAGATGVKFQCFHPERLAMKRSRHPRIPDIVPNNSDFSSLFNLYQTTHTPLEWFPTLKGIAMGQGLTWHASVFDPEGVDFLETLACPRYKISAFEAWDSHLIHAVRETGKPGIISLNQNEIHLLPERPWIVLHATDYGVSAEKAGLDRLRNYADQGTQRWGISDHTLSYHASIAATVLGASMIEWHIKLFGTTPADNDFSWLPETFQSNVAKVRYMERCLQHA